MPCLLTISLSLSRLLQITKRFYRVSYPDVVDAFTTLDVAALGLDGVDETPFHLSFWFNVYRREAGRRSAVVEVYQKTPGRMPPPDTQTIQTFDGDPSSGLGSWLSEAGYLVSSLVTFDWLRYIYGLGIDFLLNLSVLRIPPGQAVTDYNARHMVEQFPEYEEEFTFFPVVGNHV